MSAPGASCAICGTRCRPPFRAPAAELAPDLDGRPGEPARSTLPRWVVRCGGCGAAAPDLASLPQSAAEIMRQDGYRAEADRFLRWAMLAPDPQAAAEAVLQAAWLREDKGGDATDLRRRAAAQWRGDPLRRIDILRRAGAMDEAMTLAAALTGLDEEQRRVVAFQRDRIAVGDAARYSIGSALRPPSRTPHVTHGQKPAEPGFFARLFGR